MLEAGSCHAGARAASDSGARLAVPPSTPSRGCCGKRSRAQPGSGLLGHLLLGLLCPPWLLSLRLGLLPLHLPRTAQGNAVCPLTPQPAMPQTHGERLALSPLLPRDGLSAAAARGRAVTDGEAVPGASWGAFLPHPPAVPALTLTGVRCLLATCCSALLGQAMGSSSGWARAPRWSPRERGTPGCWLQAPALARPSPVALGCPSPGPPHLPQRCFSWPPSPAACPVPGTGAAQLPVAACSHPCVYHRLCQLHGSCLAPCTGAVAAGTDLLGQLRALLLWAVVPVVRAAVGGHEGGDLRLHRLILLVLWEGGQQPVVPSRVQDLLDRPGPCCGGAGAGEAAGLGQAVGNGLLGGACSRGLWPAAGGRQDGCAPGRLTPLQPLQCCPAVAVSAGHPAALARHPRGP